jgi:hypothetical protein
MRRGGGSERERERPILGRGGSASNPSYFAYLSSTSTSTKLSLSRLILTSPCAADPTDFLNEHSAQLFYAAVIAWQAEPPFEEGRVLDRGCSTLERTMGARSSRPATPQKETQDPKSCRSLLALGPLGPPNAPGYELYYI